MKIVACLLLLLFIIPGGQNVCPNSNEDGCLSDTNLLESVFHKFHETTHAFYIPGCTVYVVINLSGEDIAHYLHPQLDWIEALLTPNGIQRQNTTSKVFGKFYLNTSRQQLLYVPAEKSCSMFQVQKRYIEYLMLREVKHAVVVFVTDRSTRGRLLDPSNLALVQDVLRVPQNSVEVGITSLGYRINTKPEFVKQVEDFVVKKIQLLMVSSVWFAEDITRIPQVRVSTAKYNEPILNTAFPWSVVQKLRKITANEFRKILLETEEQILGELFHPDKTHQDIHLIANAFEEVRRQAEDKDPPNVFDTVDIHEALSKLTNVNTNSFNLARLLQFIQFFNFMGSTMSGRPLSHPKTKDICQASAYAASRQRDWVGFKQKLSSTVKYEDEHTHSLASITDAGCTVHKLCWPGPYTDLQDNQLHTLIQGLRPTSVCTSNVLIVHAPYVSSRDVKSALQAAECSFHTIFVFASKEILINDDLEIPGKNLFIQAPSWRIANHHNITLTSSTDGVTGGFFVGYGEEFDQIHLLSINNGGSDRENNQEISQSDTKETSLVENDSSDITSIQTTAAEETAAHTANDEPTTDKASYDHEKEDGREEEEEEQEDDVTTDKTTNNNTEKENLDDKYDTTHAEDDSIPTPKEVKTGRRTTKDTLVRNGNNIGEHPPKYVQEIRGSLLARSVGGRCELNTHMATALTRTRWGRYPLVAIYDRNNLISADVVANRDVNKMTTSRVFCDDKSYATYTTSGSLATGRKEKTLRSVLPGTRDLSVTVVSSVAKQGLEVDIKLFQLLEDILLTDISPKYINIVKRFHHAQSKLSPHLHQPQVRRFHRILGNTVSRYGDVNEPFNNEWKIFSNHIYAILLRQTEKIPSLPYMPLNLTSYLHFTLTNIDIVTRRTSFRVSTRKTQATDADVNRLTRTYIEYLTTYLHPLLNTTLCRIDKQLKSTVREIKQLKVTPKVLGLYLEGTLILRTLIMAFRDEFALNEDGWLPYTAMLISAARDSVDRLAYLQVGEHGVGSTNRINKDVIYGPVSKIRSKSRTKQEYKTLHKYVKAVEEMTCKNVKKAKKIGRFCEKLGGVNTELTTIRRECFGPRRVGKSVVRSRKDCGKNYLRKTPIMRSVEWDDEEDEENPCRVENLGQEFTRISDHTDSIIRKHRQVLQQLKHTSFKSANLWTLVQRHLNQDEKHVDLYTDVMAFVPGEHASLYKELNAMYHNTQQVDRQLLDDLKSMKNAKPGSFNIGLVRYMDRAKEQLQLVQKLIMLTRISYHTDRQLASAYQGMAHAMAILEELLTSITACQFSSMLQTFAYNIHANRKHEKNIRDKDLKKELIFLKKTLGSLVARDLAEDVRNVLYRANFPLAAELDKQLPTPPTPNSDKQYYKEFIQRVITLDMNLIDKYFVGRIFDPRQCAGCVPFYEWPISDVDNFEEFLSGDTVLSLEAYIANTPFKYDSVKGRRFQIIFLPSADVGAMFWPPDWRAVDQLLSHTECDLSHGGMALTRHAHKIYQIISEPKIFTFRMGQSCAANSTDDEYILSPFTQWTARLRHTSPVDKEIIAMAANTIQKIALVGDGIYLDRQPNSTELRVDKYYDTLV